MIPRVIHQTWKDQHIPEPLATYQRSVLAQHPDFDYRLWTDADNRNLVALHYPWFLDTYDSYRHHIERVDAARYFILFHHGGVYMDLDTECLRPLDRLLNGDAPLFAWVASPTPAHRVIGNAFMASEAGHPLFRHIVKNLNNTPDSDITYDDVMHNTGPQMLHRVVVHGTHQVEYRILGLELIASPSTLTHLPQCRDLEPNEIRTRRLVFAIHHGVNTWNKTHPPPDPVPADYILLRNTDLPGHDIDYVEWGEDSCGPIVENCNRNPLAVGFNFNGFIKGHGGKVERNLPQTNDAARSSPWVCIKKSVLSILDSDYHADPDRR